MKKYFFEVIDDYKPCDFIAQSKWYATERGAIRACNNIIQFVRTKYSIRLMCAEWDDENDTYGEIEFVRYLK